jgi:hypothetical protein
MDGDRLWLLHTPTGIFAITEYNHELTGYAPELGILDPNIFRYGGNAYFITGLYAQQKGWQVEKFEDRNCEIVQ